MLEPLQKKLEILADAAKYDASCASGTAGRREAKKGGDGIGSLTGGTGICHSFTPDGRCVSLLKILMTNYCIYDCHYCINRVSSNVQRARFNEQEVIDLTLNFYKRNYIEGLFLSSGIIQTPDYTMEALIRIVKSLREVHGFKGYIHLKTIPNASPELQTQAGWYADRLSINIEMPTQQSLNTYAPEKKLHEITNAMGRFQSKILEGRSEIKMPRYIPGGQSTQMIIGADSTNDQGILTTSVNLYRRYQLRRVYYSAFSPIPDASHRLPVIPAPLIREHRLYQADWLLRFYEFSLSDLLDSTDGDGMLSLAFDPKLAWALKNRHLFPLNLNTAERHLLLKVPGLGVRSVNRILGIRRYHPVGWADLVKLRVSLEKIKPFVLVSDYRPHRLLLDQHNLAERLIKPVQLNLFQDRA
ncbi:putative DNA modification/repair radical SAM protein [Vampirovibrio sp.]|uniref:putative DNA modification/repair radical SAM protein n=1 Tax=Vampirovibrio sp. TaxID=2717857 RepID=UPI0035935EE5